MWEVEGDCENCGKHYSMQVFSKDHSRLCKECFEKKERKKDAK